MAERLYTQNVCIQVLDALIINGVVTAAYLTHGQATVGGVELHVSIANAMVLSLTADWPTSDTVISPDQMSRRCLELVYIMSGVLILNEEPADDLADDSPFVTTTAEEPAGEEHTEATAASGDDTPTDEPAGDDKPGD